MTTPSLANSINRSPLRLAFLLIAVLLACLVMTPAARAETATAVGNCRSIRLDPASGYLPGLGQLRTYVSTYDGQPGLPLYQSLPDGSIFGSSELRSVNAQTGLYAAKKEKKQTSKPQDLVPKKDAKGGWGVGGTTPIGAPRPGPLG